MKGVLLTAAVAVALSCSQSFAADGNVSNSSLAKMGLSNVKVMSDAEGMQVRGKLAIAWGRASASASGPNASAAVQPGYLAIFPSFAGGATGATASQTNFIFGFPVSGSSATAAGFSVAGGF